MIFKKSSLNEKLDLKKIELLAKCYMELEFHVIFLWLENVVILNYNKCSKLTLTQKIEEPLRVLLNLLDQIAGKLKKKKKKNS